MMQQGHAPNQNEEAWFRLLILAAMPVATILDILLRQKETSMLLAAICCIFLWQQRPYIKRGVWRTSAVLMLLTLILLPTLESPLQALEKGLRIGALIGSLLISVGLLSRASLRVGSMRNLMVKLFELPRHQRPLALGVASQFFGGFLGLAGLTAMMEIASQREAVSEADKMVDFGAISRGYAALSLWSPMYSNMSIVLSMYGDVLWTQVLPIAFLVSTLLIFLGAALEALLRRPEHTTPSNSASAISIVRKGLPIFLVMLCFFTLMVCCSEVFNLPISALIIAGAPVVALAINIGCTPKQQRGWGTISHLIRYDLIQQRLMAGEVMLFITSGCAGVVVSQAIPSEWALTLAQMTGSSLYLSVLLLVIGIVLLSSAAIHPMLSAIVVGTMLSPELLGLPSLMHVCAVLIGWGLAIIVTPFSVISLMAARSSGIPVLTISLKNNAVFMVCAVAITVVVLGTWASSK